MKSWENIECKEPPGPFYCPYRLNKANKNKRKTERNKEREKRKKSENYYYTEFLIALPSITFFFFFFGLLVSRFSVTCGSPLMPWVHRHPNLSSFWDLYIDEVPDFIPGVYNQNTHQLLFPEKMVERWSLYPLGWCEKKSYHIHVEQMREESYHVWCESLVSWEIQNRIFRQNSVIKS